MSKRKYSIMNYIESEEISYDKGIIFGETVAKTFKKEPSFNFKSYLDGLCNGFTLELKSIKGTSDSTLDFTFDNTTLSLQTYINNEKASYNKGNKDGALLAKNNEDQFINFKSYLDGVCNGYTYFEVKSFNFFNFFNNSSKLNNAPSEHLLPLAPLQPLDNINYIK
jgi:hypothetical protein